MNCREPQPLDLFPVGTTATIEKIDGGAQLSKRLLSLGLRVGSRIDVVQLRNKGVVVANSGNRVALGHGVADKLLVIPIPVNTGNNPSD